MIERNSLFTKLDRGLNFDHMMYFFLDANISGSNLIF